MFVFSVLLPPATLDARLTFIYLRVSGATYLGRLNCGYEKDYRFVASTFRNPAVYMRDRPNNVH